MPKKWFLVTGGADGIHSTSPCQNNMLRQVKIGRNKNRAVFTAAHRMVCSVYRGPTIPVNKTFV